MSSHCVSICLLVLLGALMTSGASIQFISEKLQKNHDEIAHELNLMQVELVTDQLFSPVIRSMNSSSQRCGEVQLMTATLDVYAHIFSSVLKPDQPNALLDLVPGSQRSRLEANLQELQKKMESVRRILTQANQEQEEVMAKLKSLKANDLEVQRKALAQFKEVYQAASRLGHCVRAHPSSSN